jgi:hypothetical protein
VASTKSAWGQRPPQCGRRVHPIDQRIGLARPADAEDPEPEAAGEASRRRAHRADAEDQHRLAGDRRREGLFPASCPLRRREMRHAVIEHEERSHRVLAALGAMDAAGVGQHHAVRQGWRQLLDPSGGRLNPAQPRRAVGQARAIDVADDQDLGLSQRGVQEGWVLAIGDGDAAGETGASPHPPAEQCRRDVIDLGVVRVVLDMDAQPTGSRPLGHGLVSPRGVTSRNFWHQTGDA